MKMADKIYENNTYTQTKMKWVVVVVVVVVSLIKLIMCLYMCEYVSHSVVFTLRASK